MFQEKIVIILLGVVFSLGGLFAQSLPDNVQELEKLANKNVQAHTKLGRMYFTGEGIGIDYKLAEKWLKKAPDKGDGEA